MIFLLLRHPPVGKRREELKDGVKETEMVTVSIQRATNEGENEEHTNILHLCNKTNNIFLPVFIRMSAPYMQID